MIIKPDNLFHYIIRIVGRKHLPKNASYFCFVTKILENLDDLLNILRKKDYQKSTQDETDLTEAHCLGIGKYLIIDHDGYTHSYYKLDVPSIISDVQEQFNLKNEGGYIVSVKNPHQPSPARVGLSSTQKHSYPSLLQEKVGDCRFLPLNPPDFINYEGAELPLISQKMSDIVGKEPEINKCIKAIANDDLARYLKEVDGCHYLC